LQQFACNHPNHRQQPSQALPQSSHRSNTVGKATGRHPPHKRKDAAQPTTRGPADRQGYAESPLLYISYLKDRWTRPLGARAVAGCWLHRLSQTTALVNHGAVDTSLKGAGHSAAAGGAAGHPSLHAHAPDNTHAATHTNIHSLLLSTAAHPLHSMLPRGDHTASPRGAARQPAPTATSPPPSTPCQGAVVRTAKVLQGKGAQAQAGAVHIQHATTVALSAQPTDTPVQDGPRLHCMQLQLSQEPC
jgi:hypothetical protein